MENRKLINQIILIALLFVVIFFVKIRETKTNSWSKELDDYLSRAPINVVETDPADQNAEGADGPCPVPDSIPAAGSVAEEGAIAHDFNGSTYPNNYRVLNGEQLLVPCSYSDHKPVFQEIVSVDTAPGIWHEIWRAPDAQKVGKNIVSVEGVGTSSISVLPAGRYVSFYWYGWEWGGPVLFDLSTNKDVSTSTFGVDYAFNGPVPYVSSSGKKVAFVGQVDEFMGDGWPTVWLSTSLDPLKLKQVFSYSTTSLPEGYAMPGITNFTISDIVITFNLESQRWEGEAQKHAKGTFNYDLGTGHLTSTWQFDQ